MNRPAHGGEREREISRAEVVRALEQLVELDEVQAVGALVAYARREAQARAARS